MRFKAKLVEIALNYLDSSEMIGITETWIGLHRPLLESFDKTKAFIPDVQQAHLRLIQVQPKAREARVAAISAKQRGVDLLHDHALRALYYAHEALIEYLLAEEPVNSELVALLRQSQARLMEGGLGGVIAGYDIEVGNAARAAKLAEEDKDIQTALDALAVTKDVGGHKLVERWAALGARLGELNREKSDVLAGAAGATPEEREAREDWVDVVLTVLKALSRVTDPPDALRDLHRRVIEAAEKARKRELDARRARQAANAQEQSPVEGQPAEPKEPAESAVPPPGEEPPKT
jgi:hypothetical protein